ncbi:cytochrome c maturation protein CcmE [Sphingomonas sp.]|uniref:cytochrome c maturation protein CcmE n=1 Tax=Sphingomonas sp. TaxID=28214 RepID=UPI0025D36F9B|nr:cytochrome c maturation protein CcmE [Sphingomonas sp.]MBV9528810.1 cytochrome c maturation protein CcmE [Sphingomonas sp.]
MKPKNQRLVLVACAVVAGFFVVLLGIWGLRDQAAYFYTPGDIAAGRAPSDRPIRLGGMVEKGSLVRNDPLTIRFVVTDGAGKVTVIFRGIPPDLFREGSGVVADGRLRSQGIFVADAILAKHDERYMPPQLGNQAAEHKAGKTLER